MTLLEEEMEKLNQEFRISNEADSVLREVLDRFMARDLIEHIMDEAECELKKRKVEKAAELFNLPIGALTN